MTSGSPDPYRSRPRGGVRAPRPRRGVRALFPLLVAAWALLEIWLLMLLGDAAGGATVFLVLCAGFVLGAVVIKQAGRRAWQRLAESLQAGPAPSRERPARGGNGLTMLGGLLLMVPGLVSDALGLLCVFPPTAALLRRAGARYVTRRAGPLGAAFEEARAARDQMRMRRPDGRVVPGEVIRDEAGEDGNGDRDDKSGPRP
ncbi:FxsA family membrane protein [Streptomyces litchfieldiae]|uniref:FxsA family membrane protein n=1 Tax=Streptomyces litchfieldiae TaxID=3075543 RepID=A0ABU2MQ56_9ACTN|nr:FxsA family membrane protein [Streptomyces sp. DSM 44938]MDT0343762.1 FxsA family membrane protein [Streptomyces sp. DSM 44938]